MSDINRETTFEVYLPLDLQAGVITSNRWTGPLPVGNEHILFVDDEPAIVDIQKQILNNWATRLPGDPAVPKHLMPLDQCRKNSTSSLPT